MDSESKAEKKKFQPTHTVSLGDCFYNPVTRVLTFYNGIIDENGVAVRTVRVHNPRAYDRVGTQGQAWDISGCYTEGLKEPCQAGLVPSPIDQSRARPNKLELLIAAGLLTLSAAAIGAVVYIANNH